MLNNQFKKTIILLLMIIAGFTLMSAGSVKAPRTGVGLKGGAFGIPNQLLDWFVYEHPEFRGEFYSFEIRSYGSKGPKSVFSGLYSFEYSQMRGEGPWRDKQEHRRLDGTGEITQLNVTATIIMSLFPGLPVHPYFGAGIGLGRVSIWYEGTYTDEVGTQINERYETKRFIPVGHVPIGIAFNFKNRFVARIEGGFKNGFYVGAALTINF
jgi:opacity protein-like surface antigen